MLYRDKETYNMTDTVLYKTKVHFITYNILTPLRKSIFEILFAGSTFKLSMTSGLLKDCKNKLIKC